MVEPGSSDQECARAAGHVYLVDQICSVDFQVLLGTAASYYSQILQKDESSTEFFSSPGGERVKIDRSSVVQMPLYREDKSGQMLVLVNPNNNKSVMAIYLNGCWWPLDKILTSSDPSNEGLKQVQTFGERIVLFVLNCLIFGTMESSDSKDGVRFLAHSEGELAKIFWFHGDAVAFYSYKTKGSLCSSNSQCYQLPVLDTMFVRKTQRRRGLGTQMLQDYCQSFPKEVALGVSWPISAAMYQVCCKFLTNHPEERDRLWEVEAPGDWDQRLNIWLRIQLGEAPSIKDSASDNKDMHPDKGSRLEATIEGHTDDVVSILPMNDIQPLASQMQRKRKSNQMVVMEDVKKVKS